MSFVKFVCKTLCNGSNSRNNTVRKLFQPPTNGFCNLGVVCAHNYIFLQKFANSISLSKHFAGIGVGTTPKVQAAITPWLKQVLNLISRKSQPHSQ